VPVEAQADQVAAAHGGVAVHAALLGDVPQIAVAGARSVPVHPDGAAPQPVLTQQGAQQGGLPRPVGAQDRDELAGLHIEREVVPDHALAEAQLGIVDLEDRTPVVGSAHERACSTASTVAVIHVT
jgi:hypothetical protein